MFGPDLGVKVKRSSGRPVANGRSLPYAIPPPSLPARPKGEGASRLRDAHARWTWRKRDGAEFGLMAI